jgi:catechol 2,3-dioxygenase-like lactoylglutathione lyase family enzyme
MTMFTGIHHLALITADLDGTVRFYRDLLGCPLVLAAAEDGFKHYGFQLTPVDNIAFFAYDDAQPTRSKRAGVPASDGRGLDHVALGVEEEAELLALRSRLIEAGVEVSGPTEHFGHHSIYFHDNNGIALEAVWRSPAAPEGPLFADPDPPPALLANARRPTG